MHAASRTRAVVRAACRYVGNTAVHLDRESQRLTDQDMGDHALTVCMFVLKVRAPAMRARVDASGTRVFDASGTRVAGWWLGQRP